MSWCAKLREVGYEEITLSCNLQACDWTSIHRGSSKNGAGHMCWSTGRIDLGILVHSIVVCACVCGKSHTCCGAYQSASSDALSLLASSSAALPLCFSTFFFPVAPWPLFPFPPDRGPVLPSGRASCPAHCKRALNLVCVSRHVVHGRVVGSAASRTRLLFRGRCFVGAGLGEYVRVSREMTGRCLICNFDLIVDANGVQRTRSHTQRMCGVKSMTGRHEFSVGNRFRNDGAFFEEDCCHHTKGFKCPVVGHHVSTLLLSPDSFQMDTKSAT